MTATIQEMTVLLVSEVMMMVSATFDATPSITVTSIITAIVPILFDCSAIVLIVVFESD